MPASDMMFDEIPISRIGMNASSTETGIVMIGTMADGMCQRKIRITRLTMMIFEEQLVPERCRSTARSAPSGRRS